MPEVVTFGEAMIRLSPLGHQRLEQAGTLDVAVGGSELNVATGTSRLGLRSSWVSCLPDNPLGRMAAGAAQRFGVDTSSIVWAPDQRMGLYWVEYGASPRASSVLYDRADSAIARAPATAFDWPTILAGARLFHTTGITAALSPEASTAVRTALQVARRTGALTSYDLNYRARLWTEDEARSCQEPLMEFVDILITTEEDAARVFGIRGTDYADVARRLAERFDLKVVTITVRGDHSVLRNSWTALAWADGRLLEDRAYEIELVDRVGGGDAYAAGFLFGYLTGDAAKGVRYGNAFSALKQTSWSDLNYTTLREVEGLLAGSGTRISR